ncbi:hypothetical protein CLOP_g974 [Closterium sp. NIES-67]|nr:hypothetical protein CLOP_g974 [Closterium sp. NIES-67]
MMEPAMAAPPQPSGYPPYTPAREFPERHSLSPELDRQVSELISAMEAAREASDRVQRLFCRSLYPCVKRELGSLREELLLLAPHRLTGSKERPAVPLCPREGAELNNGATEKTGGLKFGAEDGVKDGGEGGKRECQTTDRREKGRMQDDEKSESDRKSKYSTPIVCGSILGRGEAQASGSRSEIGIAAVAKLNGDSQEDEEEEAQGVDPSGQGLGCKAQMEVLISRDFPAGLTGEGGIVREAGNAGTLSVEKESRRKGAAADRVQGARRSVESASHGDSAGVPAADEADEAEVGEEADEADGHSPRAAERGMPREGEGAAAGKSGGGSSDGRDGGGDDGRGKKVLVAPLKEDWRDGGGRDGRGSANGDGAGPASGSSGGRRRDFRAEKKYAEGEMGVFGVVQDGDAKVEDSQDVDLLGDDDDDDDDVTSETESQEDRIQDPEGCDVVLAEGESCTPSTATAAAAATMAALERKNRGKLKVGEPAAKPKVGEPAVQPKVMGEGRDGTHGQGKAETLDSASVAVNGALSVASRGPKGEKEAWGHAVGVHAEAEGEGGNGAAGADVAGVAPAAGPAGLAREGKVVASARVRSSSPSSGSRCSSGGAGSEGGSGRVWRRRGDAESSQQHKDRTLKQTCLTRHLGGGSAQRGSAARRAAIFAAAATGSGGAGDAVGGGRGGRGDAVGSTSAAHAACTRRATNSGERFAWATRSSAAARPASSLTHGVASLPPANQQAEMEKREKETEQEEVDQMEEQVQEQYEQEFIWEEEIQCRQHSMQQWEEGEQKQQQALQQGRQKQQQQQEQRQGQQEEGDMEEEDRAEGALVAVGVRRSGEKKRGADEGVKATETVDIVMGGLGGGGAGDTGTGRKRFKKAGMKMQQQEKPPRHPQAQAQAQAQPRVQVHLLPGNPPVPRAAGTAAELVQKLQGGRKSRWKCAKTAGSSKAAVVGGTVAGGVDNCEIDLLDSPERAVWDRIAGYGGVGDCGSGGVRKQGGKKGKGGASGGSGGGAAAAAAGDGSVGGGGGVAGCGNDGGGGGGCDEGGINIPAGAVPAAAAAPPPPPPPAPEGTRRTALGIRAAARGEPAPGEATAAAADGSVGATAAGDPQGGSRPGRASGPPPPFKYVDVVRKKADREMLQAGECETCRKFYDAILEGDVQGVMAPRCEQHQVASRHRWRFAPPSTPPGYWNVGFDSDV